MFHKPVLYCISDPSNGDPVALFESVVNHGIDFFQFRHKGLPPAERAEIAKLLAQSPRGDTRLFVNGLHPSPDELNIDGVHLPSGQSIERVRAFAGAKMAGCSAHSLAEAVEYSEKGADYILLAPIFPPLSKLQDTRNPLGLDVLQQVCILSGVPVLALGGISPRHFGEVLDAGAAGVAGISLFADPDGLRDVVAEFRETADKNRRREK